jgi:heme/copper-type cytochrome/quinol oxidase subunit 2
MRRDNQGDSMVAEDTVFSVLYDKFMFWSILVGILTFGWMFIAMLRYRDGVEPDTTDIDHIEVGSFPVDRHNTPLEVVFYLAPTVIVLWLIVLAVSSNAAVWVIPADEEAHNMKITGKQWFWDFEYEDSLTWEDDEALTSINVDWSNLGNLYVNASGSEATNVTVTVDGVASDYALDQLTSSLELDPREENSGIDYFNPTYYSFIEVTNADGDVLHTWMHIPVDHKFSSAANEPMILPCDTSVVFNMKSLPSDESNPNYVGVQHSFWLPEWGVKEDLVPGHAEGTWMTVMPDDPGMFPIKCAEYCGNQHAYMTGDVKIVAAEGMNCNEDTGVKKTGNSEDGGDY